MSRHDSRARSGPHSVHDARQHAWSLLIFGPGAPAPRQRVHPGMLPDVYVAVPGRGSILSRVIAFFRRVPEEAAAEEGSLGGTFADGAGLRHGQDKRKDRLAA